METETKDEENMKWFGLNELEVSTDDTAFTSINAEKTTAFDTSVHNNS